MKKVLFATLILGAFALVSCGEKVYHASDFGIVPNTGEDMTEEVSLTLIPYYAFANRGESDMLIWFNKK